MKNNEPSSQTTAPAPRSWRLPHLMWGLSATMQFPKVTRTATHYGIVWGPWFLGFVHGGKQHVR